MAFNVIFLLTWRSSVFQTYPEFESTWPTAKCRERKCTDTWYYIVTCATLYVSFSAKSKAINAFSKICSEFKSTRPVNSSKEEILSRDSKELFLQRFLKVFDQNRKHVEARNHRTDPSWLYRQKQPPEVLYKKAILKSFAISTGNTCSWRPLDVQLY